MKYLLQVSILFLLFISCKRKEADYIGPAFVSAPEGFAVVNFSATPTTIDFTSGTVAFSGTLTHSVTWILTIEGQVSGAVREIRGTSSSFSNIVWNGNHNGVAFFRKGETAVAKLSFYGTTYVSDPIVITINDIRNFKTFGQFPLYGDFENFIKPDPGPPVVYSPYWAHFNFPNPIPNVEQGVDSVLYDFKGNRIPSVEGKEFYYIRGKGDQAAFVSGVQYFGPLTPVLPADASTVWVNMYIYGTGDPNTGVELEYQEADQNDPHSPSTYNGEHDDAFVARITLDHKGWKLFSFQYSKLTPSLNAKFGGSGNKIHEPHRLKSFDLILIKKSNPESPVEVYFDYPIITVGAPFDPSNY